MKVKELMKTRVEVATPQMTLEEALIKMRSAGVKFLVVVDGERKVVGVITDSDIIIKGVQKGDPSQVKVFEVMTKEPFCVSPEDDVMEVVSVMREKSLRRFPVVDNDKLVGIISVSDLTPHILIYLRRLGS